MKEQREAKIEKEIAEIKQQKEEKQARLIRLQENAQGNLAVIIKFLLKYYPEDAKHHYCYFY